jgi:hypothetical protein
VLSDRFDSSGAFWLPFFAFSFSLLYTFRLASYETSWISGESIFVTIWTTLVFGLPLLTNKRLRLR